VRQLCPPANGDSLEYRSNYAKQAVLTPRHCHADSLAGGAQADLTRRWLVGDVEAADEGVTVVCSLALEAGGPAARLFCGNTPSVPVLKTPARGMAMIGTSVDSLHASGSRRFHAQHHQLATLPAL
jgi:hypothetical protein